MDIKIGELRINLSALKLYKHFDGPTINPYIARMKATRTLYRWDCDAQTGAPPQRLPKLKAETLIKFLVTDENGLADNQKSQELLSETLDAADFARVKDLDAEVQNQLKPLVVPIDWDKLWLPYKDKYSLTINFQVTYLECIGRPYGMQASDYIYFFIPVNVTFTTILGKSCGGDRPEGTSITGPVLRRAGEETSERIDALEEQIDREEEEARRRSLPDHFFGLDFNHEGTLLDDPEEDEEGNEDPPTPNSPPDGDGNNGGAEEPENH